ncbi:MAG: ABC transporter ATP-binding protein [Proteobacteria bacterium]|nr:ABC transporter ATP-binding protein [Pseudomonadota bacterium]
MTEAIIKVEGLSKRYQLGHRMEVRGENPTLRDGVGRIARNMLRTSKDVMRGQEVIHGDDVEEFWALKEINFDVAQGEVLGIIGRNGAGKSTLLKVLSRITEPSSGRVTLRGRVASLLEVGTGFHPELSGRENIYLNGAILGMNKGEIRKRFDEIVAFSEVEKFLDTPVKRYSSGMYVRLAFAVAAHLEPEILIVDEVLAVGDAAFQAKCIGKMQDVSTNSGRTVLFVSHNMAAIQQLCSRAIMLRQGSVLADGDPRSIISTYMTSSSHADETGNISLRDWPDRVTDKSGMIVRFEVCDEKGAHIGSAFMGDKVRFIMTIELYRPVTEMQFGIFVHAATGEGILELRSSHEGLKIDSSGKSVIVEVTVDNIGLYPGEYMLSPWCWDQHSSGDIDWVEHCSKLNVMAARGPHGELTLKPQYGKYFVRPTWNIHDGE